MQNSSATLSSIIPTAKSATPSTKSATPSKKIYLIVGFGLIIGIVVIIAIIVVIVIWKPWKHHLHKKHPSKYPSSHTSSRLPSHTSPRLPSHTSPRLPSSPSHRPILPISVSESYKLVTSSRNEIVALCNKGGQKGYYTKSGYPITTVQDKSINKTRSLWYITRYASPGNTAPLYYGDTIELKNSNFKSPSGSTAAKDNYLTTSIPEDNPNPANCSGLNVIATDNVKGYDTAWIIVHPMEKTGPNKPGKNKKYMSIQLGKNDKFRLAHMSPDDPSEPYYLRTCDNDKYYTKCGDLHMVSACKWNTEDATNVLSIWSFTNDKLVVPTLTPQTIDHTCTNPNFPCKNNGTCSNNKCNCPHGYTGTKCENKLPPIYNTKCNINNDTGCENVAKEWNYDICPTQPTVGQKCIFCAESSVGVGMCNFNGRGLGYGN